MNFYFITFVNNFDGHFAYLKTLDFYFKNKPQRKASAKNVGTSMPTCCFSFDFCELYIYHFAMFKVKATIVSIRSSEISELLQSKFV